MKKLNIGLFGFGTVGKGLFDVIRRIDNPNVSIKRVCVRDITKKRDADLPFTDNPDEIFGDPEINLIVELIDDADAAYDIVKRALKSGLPAVSGNKKMLAYHIEEMIALQEETGTPLLYDASACGSIPVIRNLEEYYDNDLLISVKGILNGSSNFILSKIFNENMSYADALKLAQDLGFAESNPSLDIDGWDSVFKLVILTIHAFGTYVAPEKIFTYGISTMTDAEIRFANQHDRRIKLVAHVEKLPDGKVTLSVMPHLISRNKYIYSVEDEFNGVVIKGLFYYKQFMFGQGAGGHPTGSAVLSDITACGYDYHYEYKKRHESEIPEFTNDRLFRVYYRYSDNNYEYLVPFRSISEKYSSKDFSYIIGEVNLKDLLPLQEQLRKPECFIAAYPND